MVYTADNVLTPAVIKTIYRQRKLLNQLSINNKTFDDFCIKVTLDDTFDDTVDDTLIHLCINLIHFCMKVPILKFPDEGLLACNGKKDADTTVVSGEDITVILPLI